MNPAPPGHSDIRPAFRAGPVRGPAARPGRPRTARAGPARRGDRRLAGRGAGRVAVPVQLAVTDVLARDTGRAGGGGLHRPRGPVQQHRGPGPGRPGRGPAVRLGHRHRPAGQGHRAHPSPRPGPAGQPGAVFGGSLGHARAIPPARCQRRPTCQGRHPDPARNPYSDEAIEARYHTTVIALMELERRRVDPGAPPEELSLEGLK